jgi:hypothetical protein
MANVVNRTAVPVVVLYSVNTPDYPETEWIINPDLTALASVPQKYWKVSGDLVIEMTAAEKAVVDAAELVAYKTKIVSDVCNARERKIDYGQGAEYPAASGKYLACTDRDQGRWLYWQSIGGKWNSLGMNFPFVVHSRDGLTSTSITKANDFTAVVEAIGVHVQQLFVAAETVIQNVLAATTIAGVDSASSTYIASAPQVDGLTVT